MRSRLQALETPTAYQVHRFASIDRCQTSICGIDVEQTLIHEDRVSTCDLAELRYRRLRCQWIANAPVHSR